MIEFFRQQENEKNQEISNILLKIVWCLTCFVWQKSIKIFLYKLKSSTYGIRRYTLLFRIFVFAYVFQKMICITYTNTHHTPHSTANNNNDEKNGSIHINNLILNACWTEK